MQVELDDDENLIGHLCRLAREMIKGAWYGVRLVKRQAIGKGNSTISFPVKYNLAFNILYTCEYVVWQEATSQDVQHLLKDAKEVTDEYQAESIGIVYVPSAVDINKAIPSVALWEDGIVDYMHECVMRLESIVILFGEGGCATLLTAPIYKDLVKQCMETGSGAA